MGEYVLGPDDHIAWMTENFSVMTGVDDADLDLPVAACPGWRIDTVLDHMSRAAPIFGAYIGASVDANPLPELVAALPDNLQGVAAREAARRNLDALLEVAATADPTTPCPFFTGPADVATMLWHAAAESWVHRVDVELALGRDRPPLGPPAGLDELRWTAMFRRLLGMGAPDGPPATLDCIATDSHETVTIGDGPAVASVRGTGADLSLALWSREHGPLEGEPAAVAAWARLDLTSPLD